MHESKSDRIVGLTVGGKAIYFNVNKVRDKEVHYLTIIAKKGNIEEKLVLFDSQIPSFVHKVLEAYAEICQFNGVPLPGTALPLPVPQTLEDQIEGEEPQVPKPSEPKELKAPVCGRCERKPSKWYEDKGLEAVGSIHVYVSDETGNYLLIKCQDCGWIPEDSEKKENGYGMYRRNTPQYNLWKRWAS